MMNPLLDALRQAELGLPIDYDERAVHVPEYRDVHRGPCGDCGKPSKSRDLCGACYERSRQKRLRRSQL